MGLDFRVDDSPRYRLTGVVGEPEADNPWKGRTFDAEVIDRDEFASVIESHSYDGPITLSIETVWQEPPLIGTDMPVAPRWAYSGFMRFRERIAKTIDVDLAMMENFYDEFRVRSRYFSEPVGGLVGDDYKRQVKEAKRRWESEAREWSEIDSDLVPLLNHSDCDGDLSPEDCARVAPALRAALAEMALDGHLPDHDVESGGMLAAMMDYCAQYNRRLAFC
jgi:hypothetical protein